MTELLTRIPPDFVRIAFLLLIGGAYLAYHLSLSRRRRRRQMAHGEATRQKALEAAETPPEPLEIKPLARKAPHSAEATEVPQVSAEATPVPDGEASASADAPEGDESTPVDLETLSGEELYARARNLPHQPIPDFEKDGDYLKMLAKSAEADYTRAQVKLGEYAMRRAAWVEAYYWMMRARRNGMHGLAPILCEIQGNWIACGCPVQAQSVNELFSGEASSIGRAWLNLDSGNDIDVAYAFLKTNHPELL